MSTAFETEFGDDLRPLSNALKGTGFRFILVGHNHRSIYTDTKAWVERRFPARPCLELPLFGKDYRAISDALNLFQQGIVLIPDFDWLFRPENTALLVAFNQRRDYFTQRDFAFLCFVQPSNLSLIAKKLPDWWSGRSLELHFQRDVAENALEFIQQQPESSSLGGETLQEKEAELTLLLRQLELVGPENRELLFNLHDQIATIFYKLARWEEALKHLESMLALSQETNDQKGLGMTLNNISQIHSDQGDYDTALRYLEQSLKITQAIGDRAGEGMTLNNIGHIYDAKGDYDIALWYLEQSLKIQQAIGDRAGEGTTLNNIATTAHAKGDYDTALQYLEQSLKIVQAIGDQEGKGRNLNNISQIYKAKGDYDTALQYLEQSLKIQQTIGDRAGEGRTLNNIATTAHAKGDYDMALQYLEQSLKIMQAIGDRAGEGAALNNISQIHSVQGDYDTAFQHLEQSLKISQAIGDISGMAITLNNMGAILFKQNRLEEAIPLLLQAHQIFEKIGSPNVQESTKYLNLIYQQIGEARFKELAAGK